MLGVFQRRCQLSVKGTRLSGDGGLLTVCCTIFEAQNVCNHVVAVVERHDKLLHRRMWTLQPNGESGPRHAGAVCDLLEGGKLWFR